MHRHVAAQSRGCHAWFLLLSCAVLLAALTQVGSLDGAPPQTVALEKFDLLTLRGRVVWLAEAMTRLHGVKTVPEAATRVLALETADGKLYPLAEDIRGRGFRRDERLRQIDLELFVRISGKGELDSAADVPFSLLLPAYVTSELKTAFQISFLIFLPFLIIDLVVASVLMSMGMMMLSPMIVSLPFKLMLFVLADGWALIMEMLAASFFIA
jgi:hypothetical protein